MESLVQAIHEHTAITGNKFVITISGGGISSFSQLIGQAGASNTVLELNCPYSMEASEQFLGGNEIKQHVSQEVADAFALTSLNRARELYVLSKSTIEDLECIDKCYGVGVTCALASKTWKRGDHRCYITILSSNSKHTFYINLFKGTEDAPFRTRKQEDELIGSIIIKTIAWALNIIELYDIVANPIYDSKDTINVKFDNFYNTDIIEDFIRPTENQEKINNILRLPSGKNLINVPIHKLPNPGKVADNCTIRLSKVVLVPGSFNPLHDGHKFLLEEGKKMGNTSNGLYELCVFNVDKPPLDKSEIMRRLEQFDCPIILTNTPTFVEKAKMFPGVSYSIGIDTALRLIDPIYSNDDNTVMIKNLLKMGFASTEFFIASRTLSACSIGNRYGLNQTLQPTDLVTLPIIMDKINPLVREMFKEIVDNIHKDVSSSAIRNGN
jgi:cytidyltransferase-like protein